jgi:hypothetical protein
MSAVAKRPPLPLVLTAYDLLDGEAVFWTGEAWSPDHRRALVAADEAAAEALEARARTSRVEVVDPYLVDVEIAADGAPNPRHFRERLRTLGPSVRPDLGRQAARRRIGA